MPLPLLLAAQRQLPFGLPVWVALLAGALLLLAALTAILPGRARAAWSEQAARWVRALQRVLFGEGDGPRPTPLEEVLEAELGEAPARPLLGLALSGGGIRSATFNLGLLQGLERLGLLKGFDYLSTVSGGGYIGAFWSRGRARGLGDGELFDNGAEGEPTADVRGVQAIDHLRQFGNFLAPRFGIFSYDTGRVVATMFNAVLPAMVVSLALLVLVSSGWLTLARLLFDGRALGPGSVGSVTVAAVTLVALLVCELLWVQGREPAHRSASVLAFLLALLVAPAAWHLLLERVGEDASAALYSTGVLPLVGEGTPSVAWLWLLAPCLAWAVGIALVVAARTLAARWTDSPRERSIRAAFERSQARLAFLACAWLALSLLWFGGAMLHRLVNDPGTDGVTLTGVGGAIAALGVALTRIQQLAGRLTAGGGQTGLLSRLGPALPRLLAYAFLALVSASVMALLVELGAGAAAGAAPGSVIALPPALGWTVAGAALVTLLALLFFDPNEMGIHGFYRSRLVRAYLGASNPDGVAARKQTEELPGDDLPLDELAGGGPFHLVCCAANDQGADALSNLNRGARSAVLSRAGIGVDGVWARWSRYGKREVPTLGSAITASGAAFNTLMGSYTRELGPAVTFFMAMFNLRLGLWIAHPERARARRPTGRLLAGGRFYREMLGRVRADAREVHLSDGGHFENLGVYELVRRRCRVIVASDCGADPAVTFADVARLVRLVRRDFGVDIRIDVSPLRPHPETGLARQPMVAGDIYYPDGDTGLLLLFKPTIVGNEPVDVAQYRTRNARFPHESTGDQFYDEAQWESYRRLGQHAAGAAFRRLQDDLRPRGRQELLELFARARREWQPVPAGYLDSISRFADRVAELDGLLRDSGCETLLHEVYKEIPELDRQLAGERKHGAGAGVSEGGGTGLPARADLAPSLHLVRRALLILFEVYQRDDLERNYGHPGYLGLMNYFARWAYAPLFRMWWPLLKTMYPQPFARFVEQRFGLDRVVRGAAGDARLTSWVDGAEPGFAMSCWLRERGLPDLDAGQRFASYHIAMHYPGGGDYSVQAGLVLARQSGSLLMWDGEDFFVPPGLWGVGIGTAFLRSMGSHGVAGAPVTRLVARVRRGAGDGSAEKKDAADTIQLYRGAGFVEADRVNGTLLQADGGSTELPPEWLASGADPACWFVREVSRVPVGAMSGS